jgi:oligopeptide transport system substrate-binding protein
VAYSWDVLEAGHKYIFHLRDDVKWSNGTPVTAGDFEYAWKRALHPAYNLFVTDLLEDIKGAKAYHRGETATTDDIGIYATDERTLTVELEKPVGYFLYLIPFLFPVPRDVVEAFGKAWAEPQNIVTNGPFILEAWLPEKSMILSRNPRYHGQFAGNVQRVELCINPSMTSQLEEYEAGRLDFFDVWTLPLQERDRARQRNAKEYIAFPELSTFFLILDVSQPPFDDVRVRRAVALATDKEKLANVIMRGCVAPATGGLIPLGMTGYSNGIGFPYDPGRAKQLLVEAGYSNGKLHGFSSIDAILPEGSLIHYGDSLRMQWIETLDVDVHWQVIELASYSKRIKGKLPGMVLVGWMPECPDPGILLRANRIQQYSHWHNERFVDLIDKAGQMTDQSGRMSLYREADRLLMDEAPLIPLTYGRSMQLVKPWVKNYSTSPITRCLWKDIIIEPH